MNSGQPRGTLIVPGVSADVPGLRGAENPPDPGYEPFGTFVESITKNIDPMKGGKQTATTNLQMRKLAVVEPYGDQPWLPRRAQPQLLDCQHQLLVLVTDCPCTGVAREAGDEGQRILDDRTMDPLPPVLTRPQGRRVSPHWYPSVTEHLLQPVDIGRVLTNVREEGMPPDLAPAVQAIPLPVCSLGHCRLRASDRF